jgi:site-specific DNA-methyltransferase (adenine-specific)
VRPGAQVCFSHPKTVEWGTPQEFYDDLDAEFGFTLDVAANVDNAKCERYFTPEVDGLAQDWGREVCWMNPPYGRAIKLWMQKAYESSRSGATVVCLVPARTDTAWWWDYAMQGEIRFIRGRLKFTGGSKTNPLSHNAPFPVAVVVFRPSNEPARWNPTATQVRVP